MLIRLLLMPLYAGAFVEVGGKNARPVARITYEWLPFKRYYMKHSPELEDPKQYEHQTNAQIRHFTSCIFKVWLLISTVNITSSGYTLQQQMSSFVAERKSLTSLYRALPQIKVFHTHIFRADVKLSSVVAGYLRNVSGNHWMIMA